MFLLIVNTSAGGFPIGILVSTSESEAMIYETLTLYKTFIKPDMFNEKEHGEPSVFMKDESTAEREKHFPVPFSFSAFSMCWPTYGTIQLELL